MTDKPVLIWDDFDYLPHDAFPGSQSQSSHQVTSPWTPQQSVTKGVRQPMPGMCVPLCSGATSVRPSKYKSFPYDNIGSMLMPAALSHASSLPSIYPAVKIVGNPCYSNICNTLRNNGWPVQRQHVMPIQRDVVHVEQTRFCDFVACPGSTSHECCARVSDSIHHHPRARKPRVDRKKANAATKSGSSKPVEITIQFSQEKPTAPVDGLPLPPPLIKTCEINEGIDHKNCKQPHCKAATGKKGCKRDVDFEERQELSVDGSKRKPLQSAVGTFVSKNRPNTHQEFVVTDDSPPKEIHNGKPFCKVGHKVCLDHCSRFTQSNQLGSEVRPRRTEPAVTMGYGFPRQPTKYSTYNEDESRGVCLKESLLEKPQRDTAITQNGHFALSIEPQGNQNTLQDGNTDRHDQQQPLSIATNNCGTTGSKTQNNQNVRNDGSTYNLSILSRLHQEWNNDIFASRQDHPTSLAHAAPRPQYSNTQRGRSKSCDDAEHLKFNPGRSVNMHFTPDCSSYRAQLMQKEKAFVQDFKSEFGDGNGTRMCNSPIRRYKRSKSLFCHGTKIWYSVQKTPGNEVPTPLPCYDNKNKSAAQAESGLSSQPVPFEQPVKANQMPSIMASARLTHQSSKANRKGEKRQTSVRAFNRQDQLRTSKNTCTRTSIISDPIEIDSPMNQKSSSTQKRDGYNKATPHHNRAEISYLMRFKESFNMGGLTTLNELKIRRNSTDDQMKFNSHYSLDENVEKEVLLSSDHPEAKTRTLYEQRRGKPVQAQCKLIDNNEFQGNSDKACDEHYRPSWGRFPIVQITVPHSQEVTEEFPHYQVEGNSSKRKLSTASDDKVELPSHRVQTSVNAGGNERKVKATHPQETCSRPRNLPPLPSDSNLDSADVDCGGFAIDHSALPKIVAVHSIVGQKKGPKKVKTVSNCDSDESRGLESKTRARTVLTGSQSNALKDQLRMDPDEISAIEKGNGYPGETLRHRKILSKAKNWTLWNYLSSPSKELTIEVEGPAECVEVVKTEKKQQTPRKKLTVPELSKKILYTRERIQKETIPWKKKLLFRLEKAFIRRLRKTEKETQEKADIVIDDNKNEEESTLKNVKTEDSRQLAKGRKSSTKCRKPQLQSKIAK